ncbi:MAG: hypothetical protein RJA99_3338 [Pseudomonadota bacterium]|jgi:hypothetical protein
MTSCQTEFRRGIAARLAALLAAAALFSAQGCALLKQAPPDCDGPWTPINATTAKDRS